MKLKLANPNIENEEGVNHLLIEVEPDKKRTNVKKPVAIITINDISGSMSAILNRQEYKTHTNDVSQFKDLIVHGVNPRNEEIVTSLDYLKKANKDLIQSLSEEDIMAIVTFGSFATVEAEFCHMTKKNKKEFKEIIDGIDTNGLTNVSEAIEMAYDMITDDIIENYHVKLMLISDGEANMGIKDLEQLAKMIAEKKKELPITTIGISENYNAGFMSGIAIATSAMFYHLKDTKQLKNIFEDELANLLELNMKKAVLEISSEGSVTPNVKGNLNDYKVNENKINLGNVYHKQQIMIEINTEETEKQMDKLVVTLTYETADKEKVKEIAEKEINIVEDGNVFPEENNQEVLEVLKELINARNKKEALKRYEKNDYMNATSIYLDSLKNVSDISNMYQYDLNEEDNDNFLRGLQNNTFTAEESKKMFSQSFSVTRNKKE